MSQCECDSRHTPNGITIYEDRQTDKVCSTYVCVGACFLIVESVWIGGVRFVLRFLVRRKVPEEDGEDEEEEEGEEDGEEEGQCYLV